MNWDAIGAIAELLGAVGVIGSLIYLATQVKTSTIASSVESKLRTTEFLVNFQDMLIANPQMHEVMLRGRRDVENLSKEEYMIFSNMAQKAFWYFSATYFQKRKNAVDEADWFEVQAIINYWTSAPGAYHWWRKFGHLAFTGEFSDFIDSCFARYGFSELKD